MGLLSHGDRVQRYATRRRNCMRVLKAILFKVFPLRVGGAARTLFTRGAGILAMVLFFVASACFSRVNIDVAERAVDEFHLRVAKGQADL